MPNSNTSGPTVNDRWYCSNGTSTATARQALVDLTGLIFKREGTAVDIFCSSEYGVAMDVLAHSGEVIPCPGCFYLRGPVTIQELNTFTEFMNRREYSTALVKLVVGYLANDG